MIQRIQSILLILIGLLMIGLIFTPIWQNKNKQQTIDGKTNDAKVTLTTLTLTLTGTEKTEQRDELNIIKEQKILNETKITVYIAILAIAIAGVAGYSVFQYRNRQLQMKLGAFNSLALCLIVVCIYINIVQGNKMLSDHAEGDFEIGFFLPIIAIVLNLVANRLIRRDENLVKSADRIR